MKKLLSFLTAIAIVLSSSVFAYAEEYDSYVPDEPIIEEYSYTNSISSGLAISNKIAYCSSSVVGYYGTTTKIIVTQTLQKKAGASWTGTSTWTKTFNSWYANYDNTKSSLIGGTYRLKTVAKVYKGSNYETITVYSYERTC